MRIAALLGLALAAATSAGAGPAAAQDDPLGTDQALPPAGYGSLTQQDLALRGANDEIEIRVVPLDERVIRLLARDAFESLRGLVAGHRRQIDSVASRAGVSAPGLALVTFFGRRPAARFDPQVVNLQVRNRIYQPLGIVPITPRFTSEQLEVREQVSAIYLFEERIPVTDDFSVSYIGFQSEAWSNKRTTLDRERARVQARARAQRPQ